MIVVDNDVILVAVVEHCLFCIWRQDERVFELFSRHIGLECSWLNADDGLSIYMTLVKVLSISNIDQ